MVDCSKCNDTGVNETGNNDLPCECPAGDTALFNTVEASEPIPGRLIKRHFYNNSPDPLHYRHGQPYTVAELEARAK
ncbi:hypothetical protein HN858_03400 [Candidatus Falkowbacteria bacterium]|jgi:hypothetical protein|nr:hypothetical protein [Candidatus Falkowbacteria bacterium]MBT5502668.1 hypothetical protein [Candidatus Falkowbacteria bacterium]MBT6574158.1 hypothetical protein [Candidatus Falkowbacteria bacterium]MBT7348695.1 hypothetical protein [Candidatus Falkowbacteria bacterium]MBT7500485.1 hypothetical protein [Candidatus Falkowbacteria bacterium]